MKPVLAPALALTLAACGGTFVTPGIDAQAVADCAPHEGLRYFHAETPLKAGVMQSYTAYCKNGAKVHRVFHIEARHD